MFPRPIASIFGNLLKHNSFALLASTSFEERCLGFVRESEGATCRPSVVSVVGFSNKLNKYAVQCDAKSAEYESELRNLYGAADWHQIDLAGAAPWEQARDVALGFVELLKASGADIGVIDITTMPRICYYALLGTLLGQEHPASLIVVYSEPVGYGESLLGDHASAEGVPPFDRSLDIDLDPRVAKPKPDVAWIPILGFGAIAPQKVFESIGTSYDLGDRVYPIVGHPAYDPMFYERVIKDTARDVLSNLIKARESLPDHLRFAAAWDPFETREVICELMDSHDPAVHWVGSPMGPKPMALGMLLAAAERRNLGIVVCRARSYSPDFSHGVKRCHAYLLRLNGSRAY